MYSLIYSYSYYVFFKPIQTKSYFPSKSLYLNLVAQNLAAASHIIILTPFKILIYSYHSRLRRV